MFRTSPRGLRPRRGGLTEIEGGGTIRYDIGCGINDKGMSLAVAMIEVAGKGVVVARV